MLRKFMTALPVLLVSLSASDVKAQFTNPLEQLDEEQLGLTVNFVLGNVSFELFRQATAALIDDAGLEAAPEGKNTVDQLTSVLMFEMNDIWMETAIVNATDSWFLGRSTDLVPQTARPLHTELVPNTRRDQDIACLMIGKDRSAYRDLAQTMSLDEALWDDCVANYPAVVSFWDQQLDDKRSEDVQGDFILTYIDSNDPGLSDYATMVQESKVLDMIARSFEVYQLQGPIHLIAKACGTPDVFWSKSERQITLCYEYAKYQGELVANHLIKASLLPEDIGLESPTPVNTERSF
jgi:hypothetical protein